MLGNGCNCREIRFACGEQSIVLLSCVLLVGIDVWSLRLEETKVIHLRLTHLIDRLGFCLQVLIDLMCMSRRLHLYRNVRIEKPFISI